VTIGPSFQSARQEALDTLIAMSEALPQTAPVISDLIAKNIDSPDAQEMARRLRIPLIQQGIVQPTEGEKAAGIPQKTPQQQAAEMMQQLEQQLMQARTTKMSADATIAQSRASASPLEQKKLGFEVAGKHLANIKLAHEIGGDQREMQTEHQSNLLDLAKKHADNQQDLQQSDAETAQGIAHAGITHQADQARASAQHDAEMRRADEAHTREMTRMHEKHQLTLKHQSELNEQKVAAAKALAAAKPKKSKAA